MLRLFAKDNRKTQNNYCDGISRRSFVQLGVTGIASLGLGDVLRAKAASASTSKSDVSTILIWLDGGPGHMDMYDMKPDAPVEYRGIWNPIQTKVPGFDVTELYPKQAQQTDKFSIVRSLHHGTGDHFAGAHRMLTTKNMGVSGANNIGKFPGIGAVVSQQRKNISREVPPYVSVPSASSVGRVPGYFGGKFLGVQYDPFQTKGDPNNAAFKVQNMVLPAGITVDRLEDRTELRGELDKISRTVESKGTFDALDQFDQQAFSFVTGEKARQAFDINQEADSLREKYGRHTWGQSTLLARRLVEAGASFVTVQFSGWDHHWNLQSGYETLLPRVDSAVGSLFEDLDQRGLLDTTVVMLCGEFSRTPRMNDGGNGGPPLSKGTPGRDHWGSSMFCLLGGGGIKGGRLIGSTTKKGEAPKDRPVTPSNVHATVYECMGIDPKLHILDHAGRPTPVLDDPTSIHELF
ncbi:MAG: hypothetical protein CMJ76_13300 [Planctomycetaceae bacterium]|nr:hypothetical protein [Planctomycetaceae bacterium]